MVTLSLMSSVKGELKRFFDSICECEPYMDERVIEWICVYREPTGPVEYINKVIRNLNDYRISLWVKIGEDDIIEVTQYNERDVKDEIIYIFDSCSTHAHS